MNYSKPHHFGHCFKAPNAQKVGELPCVAAVAAVTGLSMPVSCSDKPGTNAFWDSDKLGVRASRTPTALISSNNNKEQDSIFVFCSELRHLVYGLLLPSCTVSCESRANLLCRHRLSCHSRERRQVLVCHAPFLLVSDSSFQHPSGHLVLRKNVKVPTCRRSAKFLMLPKVRRQVGWEPSRRGRMKKSIPSVTLRLTRYTALAAFERQLGLVVGSVRDSSTIPKV